MADVCITEYTDPGCPWAYSAEPFRRRLSWLYGDALEWRVRMVGLAESPRRVRRARLHARAPVAGLRVDRARPRHADRHVGAPAHGGDDARVPRRRGRPPARARAHAPAAAPPAGPPLRGRAPRRARDDRRRGARRRHRPRRARALDARATTSRPRCARTWPRRAHPIDAARVLDEKLANWSGGRRYTCPSYEIVRVSDGVKIAVPGFQPFAVYDVVTANLVPGVDRRDPPESVEEVLALDRHAAGDEGGRRGVRHRLRRGARAARAASAVEQHVGADGFWSLDGAR